MAFFDLDKKWKIGVYWVGLFSWIFIPIPGWILLGINANLQWGEDIIKTKENPKFNGRLEKFFYLWGYFVILGMVLALFF